MSLHRNYALEWRCASRAGLPVLAAEHHLGRQNGGATHARLRNLITGRSGSTVSVRSEARRTQRREAAHGLPVRRWRRLHLHEPRLLRAARHPSSTMAASRAPAAEMRVTVEFVEAARSAWPSRRLEVRVAETAPPSHQQVDSVWKSARLDSGSRSWSAIIKNGDLIRLDVNAMK